jgi:hypothetical protein
LIRSGRILARTLSRTCIRRQRPPEHPRWLSRATPLLTTNVPGAQNLLMPASACRERAFPSRSMGFKRGPMVRIVFKDGSIEDHPLCDVDIWGCFLFVCTRDHRCVDTIPLAQILGIDYEGHIFSPERTLLRTQHWPYTVEDSQCGDTFQAPSAFRGDLRFKNNCRVSRCFSAGIH